MTEPNGKPDPTHAAASESAPEISRTFYDPRDPKLGEPLKEVLRSYSGIADENEQITHVKAVVSAAFAPSIWLQFLISITLTTLLTDVIARQSMAGLQIPLRRIIRFRRPTHPRNEGLQRHRQAHPIRSEISRSRMLSRPGDPEARARRRSLREYHGFRAPR